MDKQKYICLGSCRAGVTEEEYKDGLTKCGDNSCDHKSRSFVKGNKCSRCGITYPQGKTHRC